jgi:hypothetical protein
VIPSSLIRRSYAGEARRQDTGKVRASSGADVCRVESCKKTRAACGLGTQMEMGPTRHMSFRIGGANAQCRRRDVLSRQRGHSVRAEGFLTSRLGHPHGMLIKPLEPRTSFSTGVAVQVDSRNNGLGLRYPVSLGGCAFEVRDGDRCSDNRTSYGQQSFWPARGCRRAVAVQDGLRKISIADCRAQSERRRKSSRAANSAVLEQQGPCLDPTLHPCPRAALEQFPQALWKL